MNSTPFGAGVVSLAGRMRQESPDAEVMIVISSHGDNTYDVARPGWGDTRRLTKIVNVNPDIAGQIALDDTVMVGAYNGDPQQRVILAKCGFMASPFATDSTPVLVPYWMGPIHWPVHGQSVGGAFDTGDRTELGWDLPAETEPQCWEANQFFDAHSCARAAKNRVIFLRANGNAWDFQVLHVELGLTEDEARLADPSYLDADTGNLSIALIGINDGPGWLAWLTGDPVSVCPNHLTIERVETDTNDQTNATVQEVYAYASWFNSELSA